MGDLNIGLITIKLLIGFLALFFTILITGRSSITPFHYVFILLLDDLVGHAIYEDHINIMYVLYTIGLWTVLMLLFQYLSLKWNKVRFILEGKPAIIIRNGIIDRSLAAKYKLSVNQILSLLRQKDVFSLREVAFALMEPNGQISIRLQSTHEKTTRQDFHFPENPIFLATTFILDGKIIWDNLEEFGYDRNWLYNQLQAQGFENEKNIFYAEWLQDQGLHISPK
ncbi:MULTISPECIES: DUF421 domain-containing protein [Bacillus]|uniref:DUF421 domain-containing protein n=1 Tax=Bacillus TaxID=1386 RepID=UPI0003113FA4|nr:MULTISPECIES: DUF421 domain-containing protein [Bacillus]